MVGCCEEALAVYEERSKQDKDPMIVRALINNAWWSFYMSKSYISNNLGKDFGNPLPPYEGPFDARPDEYHNLNLGPDEELMELAQ